MKLINAFQGEHRFLSNFWPSYLSYDGLLYPTVEHAYQAAKIKDTDIRKQIRNCDTPAAAKEFFDKNGLRPADDWTVSKKLNVMEQLLSIKFSGKEPLLIKALLSTGDAELVEGNNWNDQFWGVCNNKGENNLGKLLMKVRSVLFDQKLKIHSLLESKLNNTDIAKSLSISTRELYEKMIGFGIKNREYWIS